MDRWGWPKPLHVLKMGSHPGWQGVGKAPGIRKPQLQVQIITSLLQPSDHKLSDQRKALSHGQNPLPIYCALNTKEKNMTTFEFGGE